MAIKNASWTSPQDIWVNYKSYNELRQTPLARFSNFRP
jgi:hypothetical protein